MRCSRYLYDIIVFIRDWVNDGRLLHLYYSITSRSVTNRGVNSRSVTSYNITSITSSSIASYSITNITKNSNTTYLPISELSALTIIIYW